jgi:ABC-type polysaccharide/polyol phosphate export permease
LSSDADFGEEQFGELKLFDSSTLPDNPPRESFYRLRVPLPGALRLMFGRREVIWALAERDVRATYKQAALGMGWALLSPIIQITLFSLIFSHVKAFHVNGVPYALVAYAGLLCWGYFSGSFSAGGSSIISNIALLNKTQFPRECFPLAQMLEQGLYTMIALIPGAILMAYLGFVPHVMVLYWAPVLIIIEVLFAAGLTLAFASLVVYVRDLSQISSIITQLGLFATPVIWPFVKIANVTWGPLHHVDMRPYYSFFNPLGPVIDSLRNTMLLNRTPDLKLLAIAAVSASLYFVIGYSLFKRLEVGFADIS